MKPCWWRLKENQFNSWNNNNVEGRNNFQLLAQGFPAFMVNENFFVDKLAYSRITNFRMAHTRFVKRPNSDINIWKKFREWMSHTIASANDGPSSTLESQITKWSSATCHATIFFLDSFEMMYLVFLFSKCNVRKNY